MAVSQGKNPQKSYQTTFVKEFFVNSEDVEKELNQWLKDNEENYEIVDIKISSCYFRDCQTKTIVLILYREKANNKE